MLLLIHHLPFNGMTVHPAWNYWGWVTVMDHLLLLHFLYQLHKGFALEYWPVIKIPDEGLSFLFSVALIL